MSDPITPPASTTAETAAATSGASAAAASPSATETPARAARRVPAPVVALAMIGGVAGGLLLGPRAYEAVDRAMLGDPPVCFIDPDAVPELDDPIDLVAAMRAAHAGGSTARFLPLTATDLADGEFARLERALERVVAMPAIAVEPVGGDTPAAVVVRAERDAAAAGDAAGTATPAEAIRLRVVRDHAGWLRLRGPVEDAAEPRVAGAAAGR